MPIQIPRDALVPPKQPYSLDISTGIEQIKSQKQPALAAILKKIQNSVNTIETSLRSSGMSVFNEILVVVNGVLIAWIGSRDGYSGGWFKQLYVGGDGPDTAPLFANADGDVIVGHGGSITILDASDSEVGWIGTVEQSPKTITGATNATPIVITSAAHGYRNGNAVLIAGVLGNTSANGFRLIKSVTANTYELTNLAGVNVAGNGAYGGGGTSIRYFGGAWLQQLYVGGGSPEDAPFFANFAGDVVIGGNGSIAIWDIGDNEVGWLGVQTDAALAVTGATNATPIKMTVVGHTYESGDTVFIQSVGGNLNANGYRIAQNIVGNTFDITDLQGVNVAGSGAYTSGGTSTRYFGGGRFQTIAIGESFDDYKLRAFADGQLKIKDALITLTDAANDGYIEFDPSNGPSALFRNTASGYQVEIVDGVIDMRNYLTPDTVASVDYSGYRLFNSSAALIVSIASGFDGGQINLSDASGSGTVALSGDSGKGSAFVWDASTEFQIGGTPGVTATVTVPTDLIVTSGSAVVSVDFTLETTDTDTFVQTIAFTDVTITTGGGIVTGVV